jgi:DNA ligase 1
MTEDDQRSSSSPAYFLQFADVCRQIEATRSKLSKTEIVSKYFLSLSDQDLRLASTFLSSKVFPPGFATPKINVGYTLIWRALTMFYSIRDSELSQHYFKYGDMGSAIEDWLRSNPAGEDGRKGAILLGESDLTLSEFYSSLLDLSRASGKGSTTRRQRIIEKFFTLARDPVEVKFIVRVLGGEMRIGLVEGLVEESIARAFGRTLEEVRSANLVTGDIGEVAVLARHASLGEAKLVLFRPTNFMLADSAPDSDGLFKKIGGEPALSEYKYDGIRAQLHFSGGVTKIFSRNLEEVTRYFPEITKTAGAELINSVILDGEIVPFSDGRPLPFQSLQRRLRKLVPSADDAPIRYFAFDVLYKEKPLILEPLSTRAAILKSLDLSGIFIVSEKRTVSSPLEIKSMFDESKSLGYEGLVVKNPGSTYKPGRRGKSWIKLKAELDTLDVVIVAAEYGHGKRAGVISDYTFAVRDQDDLKVVGKAYSGLTDAEILEMTALLKEITVQDFGYRRTVRAQVILEVAFDAIQKSSLHDSGFALRFPRIKRIRTDKTVTDIDSLDKVREIYENQKAKL